MEVIENKGIEEKIKETFKLQQKRAVTKRKTSALERIASLKKLSSWIKNHQEDIRRAIHADFKKPYPEIDFTEIFVVTSEINHAIKHLDSWMKPKKVPTPLPLLGAKSSIYFEPKGTSLIIAPWNYPFNLCLGPLVSALAAGCTAMIKPSEMTPHTSALIRRIVEEIFSPDEVAVFEGEVEVAQMLLSLPFDHIFFTGSPMVGKIIMKSASEHLSAVTLELGGKSPTIIAEDADIKDAAEKITFAKFVNCGQTCIAPDYIMVHESKKEALIEALKESIDQMYNPSGKGTENSKDYARIVNERHLKRLKLLLDDAVFKGAKVTYGGTIIEEENYFEPSIITHLSEEMDIMQEEIFGPLLPVLSYADLNEAITYINLKPKPLALYLFTRSNSTAKIVGQETSSGAFLINDCTLHFLQNELPFGGINNSGLGKSHGHFGFLAFSNEKAVMKQRVGLTSVKPINPPYGIAAKKIIEGLLKWF